MDQRLFILVRKDLTPGQQVVQACHAVEKMCNAQVPGCDVHTAVALAVPNRDYLELWERKLRMYGLSFSSFREPDMNNEITAIACLADGRGAPMHTLPLL